MIYSNCIGSQLLHQSCIKSALLSIDKRIVFGELVGNTWRKVIVSIPSYREGEKLNTFDKELSSIVSEEFGACDGEGRDGSDSGEQGGQAKTDTSSREEHIGWLLLIRRQCLCCRC